jgi:hypothetical protein
VPDEDVAFTMWLFRSVAPGQQAALSALLESNRALLARMTAVGGKRYLPYSMVIRSLSGWNISGPMSGRDSPKPKRNTIRMAC